MTCQNSEEMNRCPSTHTHLIEIPASPVESPTDPRPLDRYSLDELEEMNKWLLEELGRSTLDSSPDRTLSTNPNRDWYHLEDHPEGWLENWN